MDEHKVKGAGEMGARKPRGQEREVPASQPKEVASFGEPTEYRAETFPPGTAPPENTFTPNPISETPGQADNPDADRMHGKEKTMTDALDFPGATSGDVHKGLGHPGSGQTSQELKAAKAERAETNKGPNQGGSGMTDEGNAEARKLQEEHSKGPLPDREHNTSLAGSESVLPEQAEQVASRDNYDRR